MKTTCLVLIGLLAIFQLAESAPSDKVDCSKMDEVLDDMGSAQGLTVLNDKYPLATTAADQVKKCATGMEAIKTLKKYNKECYKSLTQQVFSAILRTRNQMNELYCKEGSKEFNDGLAASKCIVENLLEPIKKAESQMIMQAQVLHESNIPDDKMRMRKACCAVLAGKALFMDAVKSKCAAHEKAYSDYVESYTSEAFSLICPEADKLECDKLETIKTDGVTAKTKFFMTPTLKVVMTLDH